MTSPSIGFSLAESGMMIPPFVFSSSFRRLTMTRSCRGRIFAAIVPSELLRFEWRRDFCEPGFPGLVPRAPKTPENRALEGARSWFKAPKPRDFVPFGTRQRRVLAGAGELTQGAKPVKGRRRRFRVRLRRTAL